LKILQLTGRKSCWI